MANPWNYPPSGDLMNNGVAWKRGDVVNLPLVLTMDPPRNPTSLVLSGGVLPPGLFFNSGVMRIQGTIGALPKDQSSYPVVFRASYAEETATRTFDRSFRWIVDARDEEQHWENLSPGVHPLGIVNRGSNVNIQLDIVDPDGDPLVYKAVGYLGPQGSFEGLPNGLEVDSYGRIVGSPTITGNQPGDYYFKVYARDPDDLLRNPRGEGSPRTSQKIYQLTIASEIVLDARLSDVVRWETPEGSLGSTYETYPSHFAVRASPQYEVSGGSGLETQLIRYTLTARSKSLPAGLLLDPLSGMILGRCPYVTTNTTYEFTVEARVVFLNNSTGAIRQSTIASERTFNLTVRSIFGVDSVTSLQINVPATARQKIAKWIWGNFAEQRASEKIPDSKIPHELTIVSRTTTYRAADENFGKKKDYKILLASGLNYTQDGSFIEKLKDYHHPTNLRIGQLASAKARSPEGIHLYDVIYLTIIDPMEGAAGFDLQGREQILSRYSPGQKPTAIPQWNLSAQDSHYFPNSIRNLRADMQINSNRQNWPERGEQAASRGYGLVGKEGLPLWMMSEQTAGQPSSVLGYQPCIEVATVRAGSGPAIVKTLALAGMNEDLQGTTITVDRYLLLSDGYSSTSFDFDGETGAITTFDGPENTITTTTQLTTFDTVLRSESKYYKFPPGDK